MRYSEPHLLLAYTVLRRLYVLCRPNAVTFVCTLSTKQISRCSLFYKLRKLGRVLCVWLTCNIVVLTFFFVFKRSGWAYLVSSVRIPHFPAEVTMRSSSRDAFPVRTQVQQQLRLLPARPPRIQRVDD